MGGARSWVIGEDGREGNLRAALLQSLSQNKLLLFRVLRLSCKPLFYTQEGKRRHSSTRKTGLL